MPTSRNENIQYWAERYAATHDPRYLDYVLNGYRHAIDSVANRLSATRHSLDIEDLRQEGRIGLIKALQRYNPATGKFSTVAFHYIRGFIQHYMMRQAPTIRIPSWIMDFHNRRIKCIAQLQAQHGDHITDELIATSLGMQVSQYFEMMQNNPLPACTSVTQMAGDILNDTADVWNVIPQSHCDYRGKPYDHDGDDFIEDIVATVRSVGNVLTLAEKLHISVKDAQTLQTVCA